MLDGSTRAESAASVIEALPCQVQLPEKLRESFELAGPTPSMPNDHRRFPRVRCRSKRHRAALKRLPTFAALASSQQWSAVYVADFSKTGVQVLHAEQLFPGERLRLLLLTGNLLDLEVVRCRRMGDACFAVGTQIVRTEDGK